jgi:hypothetical protein
VSKIIYKDKVIPVGDGSGAVGPVLKKLYDRIRRIQNGEEVDKFNWLETVELD